SRHRTGIIPSPPDATAKPRRAPRSSHRAPAAAAGSRRCPRRYGAIPVPRDLLVEMAQTRKPAAEDDRIRVEDVNNAGQRPGETLRVAVEGRPALLIARGRGGRNGWSIDRCPAMPAVIGGEPRAGQERLDAARAAAIAGRPRPFAGQWV